METEVVNLNSVPVLIHSVGGISASQLISNPNIKLPSIILILPGNPGIGRFYDRFAYRLHELVKIPIWIVGHGGHNRLRVPALEENPNLYDLDGQVNQKRDLIQNYLKRVAEIHLIGHSIGCWMILELLKIQECSSKIKSGYFIFPVIEHLQKAPTCLPLLTKFNYYKSLYVNSVKIIQLLPIFTQTIIANIHCWLHGNDTSCISHMLYAMNSKITTQMFFLVKDELKQLQDRNDSLIRENINRLYFHYTKNDGYAPESYYQKIVEDIPGIQAECSDGLDHCFVLNTAYSLKLAYCCASFIKKIK